MEQILIDTFNNFESIRHECLDIYGNPNGGEFWYARDLMDMLGYGKWQKFENCIQRAITMCNMSGIPENQHFAYVTRTGNVRRTTPTGGEGVRTYTSNDYMLSRYGCYLIAINGNTPECAFAQAYFLTKARQMELMDQYYGQVYQLDIREQCTEADKQFNGAMHGLGINNSGMARVKSKGDEALFGGYNTQDMKSKLGYKGSLYNVLDPTVALGRALAASLTTRDINTKEEIEDEQDVTIDHIYNNESMRNYLISMGITP